MAIYNIYDPEGKSLITEFTNIFGAVTASLHYSASHGGAGGRSSKWNALRVSQSLQEQLWCCSPCSSSQASQSAAAGHITSGSCPDCGKPDSHEFYGHLRRFCSNDCGCSCVSGSESNYHELRWSGSLDWPT
jgi:hypothetical protein